MKSFPIALRFIFCLSLCGSGAWAETGKGLVDKEVLSYIVSWTGLPAGKINMVTKRNDKLEGSPFEIHLRAESNSFVSMFYKVRNLVVSRIPEGKFKSIYYYKDIRQGRRHLEEIAKLDYEKSIIDYSKQNKSAGEDPGTKKFKIESSWNEIQDPLSLIYYLRTIDFEKRKPEDKIFVFADKGVYEMTFKLVSVHTLTTSRFGARKVYHLKPTAQYKGAFISDGDLEIWLDFNTGIPLKLKFSIPIGTATMELNSTNRKDLHPNTYRKRRKFKSW